MTVCAHTPAAALAASWCPRCEEATALVEPGAACPWCNTETVPLPKPKARRGKPKGKHAKVTDTQLAALHAAYIAKGMSVRQLSEVVWEKLGYASPQSCANQLNALFRDRGYRLRDRIEATVLASTKNGLSPRDWKERKRRRLAAGKTLKGKDRRPLCKAVKSQSPGKGKPCQHRAMAGSDYCFTHDPQRRGQVESLAARMRARQPRPDTVAWEDVRLQLAPWLAQHRYPASRLAEATGVPQAVCSRLLNGRRETVTVAMASRLLVVVRAMEAAA